MNAALTGWTLDGFLRNEKLIRNLLVRIAGRDQPQYCDFCRRQASSVACSATSYEACGESASFRHALHGSSPAESQASDQTIMAIAGHVSARMLAHYSHVRLAAKRTALQALSRPAPNPGDFLDAKQAEEKQTETGYDTRHDTNWVAAESMSPEVLEKYGRHEGTRTPDLYRVKVAL